VHETPVFWEHEGNRAMRDGQWKLAWSGNGSWELYDMETDRTEMHDLSKQKPDRKKAMIRKWESWVRGAGVSLPEPINYHKVFYQSKNKKKQ
jgi:arylsulfatase A-like enzyme